MQRVLLDQVGPHAREIPFGQACKADEKKVRDGQVEHRVAQKFQPLVVVSRKTAMREGLDQQARIRKAVLKARLQRGNSAIRHRSTRVEIQLDWPLYLSTR